MSARAVPLLLALLCAAPRARAEDASALLKQGIEAFSLAEFERSRALLARAAAATQDRRLLAQIHLYRGLNDAATGAPAAARAAFTTALGLDPALSPDPAQVKRDLLELFASVRRSLQARLTLHAGDDAVRVLVDGTDRGELPLSLSLPVGKHRLELRSADGRRRQSLEVVLAPGQTLAQKAALRPVLGRLSIASTPSRAEVYVDGERAGRTPLAELELPAGPHALTIVLPGHAPHVGRVSVEPGRTASVRASLAPTAAGAPSLKPRRRVWTWVALAGALASLGTGIGLGVASNADFRSYQDRCGSSTFGLCGELRESVRSKDLVANTLFGVAGAFAVGSALLYYFEGRAEPPRDSTARVAPFAGGLGAALSGSF